MTNVGMRSRIWAALLCMALLLCCAQSALAETFTGYAQGFNGQVSVTLTVENGWITKADVSGPNETPGIGSVPIEEAPEKIVAAQGADIDMVSGATETSKAIIEATKNAMKAAGLEVETCAHENYRESSTTTSLPAGENWKDNGDGTHSANGSTWTNCYCYDCGERFEKDHQTGLLTRKHSYNASNGKCWDCGSACPHPDVYRDEDQYEEDDGAQWKPNDDGKTHSAQGRTYDEVECKQCGYDWEENVVYEALTKAHDYYRGQCEDCGYQCPHPSVEESLDCYARNSGEYWKPDDNGTTHSAPGRTYDYKHCRQCYYSWEENVVYGTITKKHSFSSSTGKCYDCDYACTHPDVKEDPDRYTLNDGEEWKPDSNGKTHSAQGKTYDYQYCETCWQSWEVNVVHGPVTRKHNFWDDECHDCGYNCPHENITDQHFNSWQLKDGERWTDDKNGMTHTGKCEVYDYFYCSDCRDSYQINVRDEVITEYHSGTNKCYDCGTYNIIDRNYAWWIDEQPKNVIVSVGETVKTSVTLFKSDKAPSVKYAWYFKDPGSDTYKKSTVTGRTYSTTMTKAMNGRQIYCVVTDAYGAMERSEVAFIMLPEFRITSQPKSVTLSAGESATFTVKATGSGLKYQWYYRDAGAENWEKSTVTKSSYTTTMKKERDGREIYCEVKDGSGEILETRIVTMKLPALKITKQPKNTSAYEDEKAKISVEATGDGLEYEWWFKNVGDEDYTKSSTTTATYSLTMNEARSGRLVYCRVRDAYGRTKDTNEVTLTMRHKATITSEPKSVTVSDGETVKFAIGATGDGIEYQWYYRNAGAETWQKASSTFDTYESAMKVERHGREVYCKVTDEYGNVAKSKTVTMKLPVAKVTVQPQNVTASDGKTVNFSIEATGDGLTYQWYYRNAGTTTWKKANSTTSSYETVIKVDRDGRQVYCKVTDQYGFTAKSDTVTMKLPAAKITSQPKSVTASAGEMVKFSVEATGDGLEYKWYYKNAGSSSWKVGSSTSASYETEMKADRDGRQVYCKVTDAYGNVVKSKTVTMSLPVAKITTQPKSASVAVGDKATFTIKATGDGLTYQWQYKKSGSSTWTNASSTGTTYSFTMKASYDGRSIRCKVKDAYGNTITSNAVKLTVK